MKKTRVYLILILSSALLLQSCASSEDLVYFQDRAGDTINESLVPFEPTIQVGDILAINISATKAEAVIPFNLYETPLVKGSYASAKPLWYLVNTKGSIQFPVIGKLAVGGLTTTQMMDKLNILLSEYIKNPIITIRIKNFKISVLGEVKHPGTYPVENERISIIDAIGLAGDLTIHGERKSVQLIREVDGKREFVKIDLTNKELFNSPYFYLAQNDVIYVAPNKTKVNSAAVGSNTGVIISSVSILVSILTLLLR